jgi:hypothetical protein
MASANAIGWLAARESKLESALAECDATIAVKPDDVETVVKALRAILEADAIHLADPWLAIARKLLPGHEVRLRSEAVLAQVAGDFDLEAAYWERIANIGFNCSPELARAYLNANRLKAAEHVLLSEMERNGMHPDLKAFAPRRYEAPALDGDTRWSLAYPERLYGEVLLKSAHLEGFQHFWARDFADGAAFRLDHVPAWRGEDLRGKTILVNHQLGYGDQMFFAPFVAALAGRGAEVVATFDQHIVHLIAGSLPELQYWIGPRPGTALESPPEALLKILAEVQPDFQATHLRVAALLSPDEIARAVQRRFMVPEHGVAIARDALAPMREAHPGTRLIGLAFDCVQQWSTDLGATYWGSGIRRSVPVQLMSALTGDPEIRDTYRFVCLHPPEHRAKIGALPENCEEAPLDLATFSETAGVIANCDAVIAVDSSVANLAVKLGAVTHVLLNNAGEWRWGPGGPASPWMPGARLHRQPVPGDWPSVMASLKNALLGQ